MGKVTGGNYRIYGDEDTERLRFVMHCRRHGMKLSEIRELLAFKDKPKTDCGWINKLVANHIANVEEQIESLSRLISRLKEQLEILLRKCSGDKEDVCGIMGSLRSEDSCPYCEDFRCRFEAHAKHNNLKGLTIQDNKNSVVICAHFLTLC